MKMFELITYIEKRPLMFLKTESITELDAFLRGYIFYKDHQGNLDQEDKKFAEFKNFWVKKKLNLPEHESFSGCLLQKSENESEALSLFFKLWSEYLKVESLD